MKRGIRTLPGVVVALFGVGGFGVAVAAEGSPLSPGVGALQAAPRTLTAQVSRWHADPAKKRKGPPGFDLEFRLVASRFDGTFGVEGVPREVPEGEAFDAQIRLTNIGKKDIRIARVAIEGDGLSLSATLLEKRVRARSAVAVAAFKVPPQSMKGSSYRITVVLRNGDKHSATLTFAPTIG